MCVGVHVCVFAVQIFSFYCIELASLIHDKYNLFLEMLEGPFSKDKSQERQTHKHKRNEFGWCTDAGM